MEKEIEEFEEEDEVMMLCGAMLRAKESFDEYFNEKGLDGAYWALYLTGYTLTSEFEKLKEVKMNINSTGYEKFEYPDREVKDV